MDASFGRNHVPFSTVANNGKHKFIELPNLGAIPAPVPGLISGESTIYTKSAQGSSQIFYTPGATGEEYQITRSVVGQIAKFGTNTALTAPTSGNGGWTFLPGGLLLQYGSFNPNVSTTVKFPISFTSPPFTVQLTGSASNNTTFRAAVSTGTLTNSQFVFEGSVAAQWNPIYFVAIGI